MIARSWGIQPSEFWSMHPLEFWWEYDAKTEKKDSTETDWDYLLTLLDD